MSPADDSQGDMEGFPFDERDSDAVFGAPGAGDVPDSLSDVADLVRAARRAGSADELVAGDVVVAGIAAAIGEHAAPPPRAADERIRVLNKSRTAKLAAAATVVVMLGGTAAAAATGTLPTPVSHHHAELTSQDLTTGPSGATGPSGPTGATGPTGPTGPTGEHHHGHHHGVSGDVASVNGSTDPSACGTGDTGMFTLTGHHGETYTVNVGPSTTYSEKHMTAPTFVNVCVGARVKVKGMLDGTTVTADQVRIKNTESENPHHDVIPPVAPDQPEQEQQHGVFGAVVSVNGSTDPAACGTGDTGSFTLTDKDGNTFTVNVGPTTTFGHGHGDDQGDDDQGDNATLPAVQSFADVCVGNKVGVKGDVTDTTVAAATVFVLSDHHGDKHGDHEGDDQNDQGDQGEHHDSQVGPSVSHSDHGSDGGSSHEQHHGDGSGDQGSGGHD